LTLTTLFQCQSFLVLVLLTCGIVARKNRAAHLRWMICALILDLALVLQVELTRSVVQSAGTLETNTLLTNIHIALAVANVFSYIITIITGIRLVKGHAAIRTFHRRAGWTSYFIRILVFATSFTANGVIN